MTERELFLQHVAQTSDFPLALSFKKAKGVYMYTENGNKCLDLISGIGVSSVGHRHPAVAKAVKKQLKRYWHLMVYGEFVQTPQVELATLLASLLPENLSVSYFVNSGSEAIEGAMKLAKRYTGRTEIVSCHHAYHGSTQGALSIGGSECYKYNYRPLLPDVRQIQFAHLPDLEQITQRTAAVIIETVQGEAGVRLADAAYFQALRQRCNEVGALLILDEIQCGMGRTGKLWAFEHYGIVPDVLVLAKGLGGGLPIGAFISSPEIMGVLRSYPILGHITTFGGHPVCAAAAHATLKLLSEERLYERAEPIAQLFREYLTHPAIREIRHIGLMMAVEFESFDVLKPIIDEAIKGGVLTDWFLFCNNSMRIAPPLTIKPKQVAHACAIVLKAIEKVAGQGQGSTK